MGGDDSTDRFGKTCPVLGDVTNWPPKKGVSLNLGDLGLKSRDGYHRNKDSEDMHSQFAKKVCLGAENLVQGKYGKTKRGVDGKGVSLLKGKRACGSSPTHSEVKSSQENIVSVISNKHNEIKETLNLLEENHNSERGDMVSHNIIEVGDAFRDCCVSSVSMPTSLESHDKDCQKVGGKCPDDEGKVTLCDVTHSNDISNIVHEGLVTRICRPDSKDLCVGRLASNSYEAADWSRLPKSQGSKFFELGRCSGLKGDGFANLNAAEDLLKACSSSFCLKAAYIWSDLHYQDIKGRIAALKKSQKEASILAQKSSRGKETGIHGQGNSSTSSKLDSDLTGQWRSLFLNMEDILLHESSQLQVSFVALKDLRENCKADLERINVVP